MSIFFVGSSGTGKTTQSLIVSSVLNIPIIDGISRSSPFLMGTSEHQQHVSRRVFKKCVATRAVNCRTPIDVMAYTTVNEVYSPADEQHCRLFAAINPITIYFPMLDVIEDDGVRPTDRGFNVKIDQLVKQYLDDYNIKYLSLKSDTPMERAEEIIEYYLEERHGDAKKLLGVRERLSSFRA